MLVNGSELSGQRRRQGAKMMASALGDMRFTSSSRATLCSEWQLGDARGTLPDPLTWAPVLVQNQQRTPAREWVVGTPDRDPVPRRAVVGTCLTRWKMSRSKEL